jgi:hypothetical protein
VSQQARPREDDPPIEVEEYAKEAVESVRQALEFDLEWDSETLPVMDHYLSQVDSSQVALVELIAVTCGAYFGEVVRRKMGGRWELGEDGPEGWRLALHSGLKFSPVGVAAATILKADVGAFDSALNASVEMLSLLERSLARMEALPEDIYYSLCGRYDTVEHLNAVLEAEQNRLEEEARGRLN